MTNILSRRGFSLVEMSISLAIGAFFLASVTGTWVMSSRVWQEENQRNEVRVDIEKAMERIKSDIRLSDSNEILFYPTGASSYTAVSMPQRTTDSNGFLTFASGSIDWNRTVAYYVYTANGTSELRRAVYSTFNSSDAARQAILSALVTNGSDGNATTTVLFRTSSATLEIVPQVATFDGYSASVGRSASTNFGSVQLSSGSHTLTFRVTGKNALSTNYGIGVDSVALTPSGGPQEAEALSYSGSGATPTLETMTSYGSCWGGGQQINFAAIAAGSSMTFTTNYDQWLESNFSSCTFSNGLASTGADPVATIQSREDQSVTPCWLADAQVVAGVEAEESNGAAMSVRTRIMSPYVVRSGVLMRIKFMAGPSGPLTIDGAWFGPATAAGSSSISGAPIQLYFDNAEVTEGGTDPAGTTASPGVLTSKTISAGCHVWTNWFVPSSAITAGGATEYLVSMSINNGSSRAYVWQENPLAGTHSYRTTAAADASSADWSAKTVTDSSNLYAVAEISTWQNTATVTSQVYDTKMTSPAYNQMSWTPSVSGSSTVTLKIRSSSSSTMSGASDWSTLSSHASSPANISALANLRYVQFQATLTSASPYTTYPSFDDVNIDWPGQTALVEVSGYFTTRPNYGQFEVLVDGSQLVKALELKLTATGTYRGQNYSFSLNTEQDPLNTGK